MKVYLIPGLGADERVFQYLDLSGVTCAHIKWERPFLKESLSGYAARLISQIDMSERPILVGMSFGGLVAQEIAQIIPCEKVILIASVKSPREYDWKLDFIKYTGVYKILPAQFIIWSSKFLAPHFFSVKNEEAKCLLHQIIKDTDPWFLAWAIDKIMTWKHEGTDVPVAHIHGTDDRIFPAYKIENAQFVAGTGHFMIVDKHQELSMWILNELSKIR